MKAIDFKGKNVDIAKNQPQYGTLPAYYDPEQGTVTFCFALSNEERKQVSETGKIYLRQKTGGERMQPIGQSCLREDNLPVGIA